MHKIFVDIYVYFLFAFHIIFFFFLVVTLSKYWVVSSLPQVEAIWAKVLPGATEKLW